MNIEKIERVGPYSIWIDYKDDNGRDCLAKVSFNDGNMVIDTDLPVLVRLAGDFQLSQLNGKPGA